MKKLLMVVGVVALASSLMAEEAAATEESRANVREDRKQESNVWPAFFALGNYPDAADIIGFRFTIPFSTKQDNVTGIDLGLWGRSLYFEGIQINVLRNDVKDSGSAFQIGLYNSVGRGDLLGIQAGLFNEAGSIRGIQAGLVNLTSDAQGIQVGLFNRAETMYGFQVGLINVIRDAELQFFPLVNIGF